MSDIAKGRAEKLQLIIVEGIIHARKRLGLPEMWISEIFGDALNDETIKNLNQGS